MRITWAMERIVAEELSCTVEMDDTARQVCKLFDYPFDGVSRFTVPDMAPIAGKFGLGLIVGPSGSGKSTLLRQHFGQPKTPEWEPNKAIVSHFANAKEAYERLGAVGLNSIPSWMRPYHVLSTGEKFRADLARQVESGAAIDEFTSVVDRNVAKSCAAALRRHVTNADLKGIVVASCHLDIIEWLQPEWIFDTSTGQMAGRRLHRRPPINLRIEPCRSDEWKTFGVHHYLNTTMNKASRCWIATWDGVKVGFVSALSFPNQHLKNAWREHRTVVLPDFQGLGIGVAISDAVAGIFVSEGCRYFSKTAHPRFGEYRNQSLLWKPTSKNGRDRQDYSPWITTKEDSHKAKHMNRVCYSHEFVGAEPSRT
jgi:GNAT superfamily N-acetyltransferase